MSTEALDAAIDLIAAVNAGVIKAIARRGYEQLPKSCATECGLDTGKK